MSIIKFKQPLLGLDLINTTPDPFNKRAIVVEREINYYKTLVHYKLVQDVIIYDATNGVEGVDDRFIPFAFKNGSENWKNTDLTPLINFDFIVLFPENTKQSFNNMIKIERELIKMNPGIEYYEGDDLHMKERIGYNGLIFIATWWGKPKHYDISSAIDEYLYLPEEK
jgi:hypothetical protein